MSDLLFDHPEAHSEGVRPETFIQIEGFPETVILPFGVPIYVFLDGYRKTHEGLIKIRRPAPRGTYERPSRGELRAVYAGQLHLDSRGPCMRVLRVRRNRRHEEWQRQVKDTR